MLILHWYLTWHFIICIFDTCIRCSRSFVLCFFNSTRNYTSCKCRTMLFMLEEFNIVNWFQFLISNKMTWLVSIFNIEFVIIRKKWILLAISCLQVYPFNIVPIQLELPIIQMIIGITELFFDFVLFDLLFFLNHLILIGGILALITSMYHLSPTALKAV